MTTATLLHNTVNCINVIISKPILCGVLLNGANGQILSICSSIALVAIPSPFLHPQYEISLPLFPLFFIPTFSTSSSCQCRFRLHCQFPSASVPDTIKLCIFSICTWKSMISLTFQYGLYIVLPPPPVHT